MSFDIAGSISPHCLTDPVFTSCAQSVAGMVDHMLAAGEITEAQVPNTFHNLLAKKCPPCPGGTVAETAGTSVDYRLSPEYLQCMTTSMLKACGKNDYLTCWQISDKKCSGGLEVPTYQEPLPKNAQTLNWLHILYGVAQHAAAVSDGALPTFVLPGLPVSDSFLPKAAPAISVAAKKLGPNVNSNDLIRSLFGYHIALKQKMQTKVSTLQGDTTLPTWNDIDVALASTPTEQQPAETAAKKSNRWLWIGGAVVVVGGIYLATKNRRGTT